MTWYEKQKRIKDDYFQNTILPIFKEIIGDDTMQYNDYCPNCSCKIIVEEDGPRYTLRDSVTFKIIDRCPQCDIRLVIENGELKEDKI